jgi:hypothetical protein
MKRLSKNELKKFQDFEEKKIAILHDIGLLQTQIHTLSHMFAENNLKLENFKKDIEKKYGIIKIDLKDGSYKKDK